MTRQVERIRQIVASPTHRLFRGGDYYRVFDVETPTSRQAFTYLDLSTLSFYVQATTFSTCKQAGEQGCRGKGGSHLVHIWIASPQYAQKAIQFTYFPIKNDLAWWIMYMDHRLDYIHP